MADDLLEAREAAARALAHPVPLALAADGDLPIVAASVAGDPPRVRVAWVDPTTGAVLARVACPPRRTSRGRPVVASAVSLDEPSLPPDRVIAGRVDSAVTAIRIAIAGREEEPVVLAGPEGLVLVRIPLRAGVIGIDALDRRGEPVGRLVGEGVSELRFSAGDVGGRVGIGHGMAAGFGPGRLGRDLDEAAFEAGYAPLLPAWLPPGLVAGRPRVEPDVAYPAAPPAIVMAWTGGDEGRVLLRQAPPPLAAPDIGGARAREEAIGAARGVLRGRGLATLVWETEERAFGLQVRRIADADRVALRVARSIGAGGEDPGVH